MLITEDLLIEKLACPELIKWFTEYFQEGGEYQEVLNKLSETDEPEYAEWALKTFGSMITILEVDKLEGSHCFFAGAIRVAGSIDLTGYLKAGLSVSGSDINVGDDITVGDFINAGGYINVGGNIEAGSGVTAVGDIDVGGDIYAGGCIAAGGDLNADNDINAGGNITAILSISAGCNINTRGGIRYGKSVRAGWSITGGDIEIYGDSLPSQEIFQSDIAV
jgi:hypothetical protein